jgi:hypothetical protein
MKVTEVSYTRRFNTAKYEHEEYGLTATLDGQDPVEALAEIKALVAEAHETEPQKPSEEKTEKSDTTKGKKSSSKPKKAAELEEAEEDDTELEDESGEEEEQDDEETPASEEEPSEETDEEESDEEESDDSEDQSEEEKEEPVKKRGRPAGSKNKKGGAKSTPYDRNSDTHKKIFAELLNEVSPGLLKKNAGRAKTVSIKMAGKEFLDSDGEVLPLFRAEVKRLIKEKVVA